MNNEFSFETLQTMVRKAFDPETISVTVGKINDAGLRYRVVIRDEITKASHIFHVNLDHTVGEVEGFIRNAAQKLNLIEGPEKIGDEIQEGAHNDN